MHERAARPGDGASLFRSPEYDALPAEDRATVDALVSTLHVPAGSTVFRQGEPGDAMFVVTGGLFRVTGTTPAGAEVTLGEIGPGEWTGEMALLTGQPRAATLTAVEDGVLARLPREGWDELARRYFRHMNQITIYPDPAGNNRNHDRGETSLQVLEEAGYRPTEEQLREILERVKELGDKGKQVANIDLQTIADVVIGEVARGSQAVVLKEVSVMTGNIITPTATVRALVRGKEKVLANTGVGPVDAAVNAVQGLLESDTSIHLSDFRIEAISGGADALAEVVIGVEDDRGRRVSARSAREDIVMASVEALISAINRLMLLNSGNEKA